MNYGRGIKIARAYRGKSQRALAAQIGLDASYISLIESGTRVPSTKTLRAISEALTLPLYLLIFLGSEGEDLRGITPEQANLMGAQLLDLLHGSDEDQNRGASNNRET
jgi:transcriptional regulator with XRE-family HTH domain